MPRSAWTRHPVSSPSPLASALTQSANRSSRINHDAQHVSSGIHRPRPLVLPGRSHMPHDPSRITPFPSLIISRTLRSGQMLIYLRDTALTDSTVQDFREKLTGPLGFDIEYRPNFIKGRPLNRTAVVQLASESLVLLVQVSAMSAFPDSIKNILEDPAVVKAGVGIQSDADKLRRDFGVHPASCLELSYLAKAVDHQWADYKGPFIGLARLVKAYQERVIQKPKRIQMSNWELPLTEEQQDYAAGDASAALSVLQKLYVILPSVQPPPDKALYLF